MTNGQHDVQLAVLEEWRSHVDADLRELKDGVNEIKSDVGTISRHVGRPLLSWPQVATLVVALLGTVGGLAAALAV